MNTIVNEELISFKELEKKIYSREQRAKQPCLHGYLATAARGAMCQWHMFCTDRSGAQTKYPAALQRCKFDTSLLAAGSLIGGGGEGSQDCVSMSWFYTRNFLIPYVILVTVQAGLRIHCANREKTW